MLLRLLLFVVTQGRVAVAALSGCDGTCRLLLGQWIWCGGGFALLPEDALWRFHPVALLIFGPVLLAFKVAVFNLSSGDWR